MSCWAAAIAMIVSWARGEKVTPLEIAILSDRMDQYNNGLMPLDSGIFAQWGMITEAPQTFTENGFMDLLQNYGPIWIAAEVFAPHVRVVTGFEYSDNPADGFIYINDPLEKDMTILQYSNKGSRYTETYAELVNQNETLGFNELKIKDQNLLYPVYFAHLAIKPRHHLP